MQLFLFLPAYISWHYSRSLLEFLIIWKNFFFFFPRVFSFGELLKTFFSPWRRLDFDYVQGRGVGEYLETLLANTLMRGVGAIIRTFVLLFLFALEIFVVVLGAILFLVWIFWPVLIALAIMGIFEPNIFVL